MAVDQPIGDILDILGDECTREILAVLAREPRSAQDLCDHLDFSRATVYRRLETLEEQDLVKSKTLVADDGNHYKLYECSFDSAVVSLNDEGYEIEVFREDSVSDRFASLWDDLQPD